MRDVKIVNLRGRMIHDSVVIRFVFLHFGNVLLLHVDKEDTLVSCPLLLILDR